MSMLTVPGANLFYKAQGRGPVLLVLQGGAADADGSDPLAEELTNAFTVVSLDRRGLSRSTIADRALARAAPSLDAHIDDALAVLDAVSPEPAAVLGVSIGALIGLGMVAKRPERVRHLIAHEPPAAELMAEDRRAILQRHQEELEETYRTRGALAAMRVFLGQVGVDPFDREPDVAPPRLSPHMGPNLEQFLLHDAPAVRLHRLDLDALVRERERITIAVGATSRDSLYAEPAIALAPRLGGEFAIMPGGHGGYVSHPRAFASRLVALLATARLRARLP